jgi:lysophospholipase L1-like esterase
MTANALGDAGVGSQSPGGATPRPLLALAQGFALLGLGLVVSFVLCEAALRLLAGAWPTLGATLHEYDPAAVNIEPHGLIGYRQKAGSTFVYVNGSTATANALGYRGPLVSRTKPPGVFRVILLGGSTMHGWGVNDSQTIDAYMRAELRRIRPDLRVEVVNLAFDGYDSYQLFERLHSDGIPMAPDIVIVHEGINDVRNARFAGLQDRDPRTLLWAGELSRLRAERLRGAPRCWDRIRHRSYLARLVGYFRETWRVRGEARARPRESAHPEAADYFERNLHRIANLAGAHGAALLFSSPPSSLRGHYEPAAMLGRSYFVVDNATTQAYRDTLAARMRAVAAQLRHDGRRVDYVARPDVPFDEFLDDAHLTPSGNRRVALELVHAILPALPPHPPLKTERLTPGSWSLQHRGGSPR